MNNEVESASTLSKTLTHFEKSVVMVEAFLLSAGLVASSLHGSEGLGGMLYIFPMFFAGIIGSGIFLVVVRMLGENIAPRLLIDFSISLIFFSKAAAIFK